MDVTSRGAGQRVEVLCQGANLSRFFTKVTRSQSPYAEVELDGQTIYRTNTHDGGNLQPRWYGKFLVPRDGHALTFRVLIAGVLGQTSCGEGTVDVQRLLRQPPDQYTVKLEKKGESTGFLSFKIISTGTASGSATPAGTASHQQQLPQQVLPQHQQQVQQQPHHHHHQPPVQQQQQQPWQATEPAAHAQNEPLMRRTDSNKGRSSSKGVAAAPELPSSDGADARRAAVAHAAMAQAIERPAAARAQDPGPHRQNLPLQPKPSAAEAAPPHAQQPPRQKPIQPQQQQQQLQAAQQQVPQLGVQPQPHQQQHQQQHQPQLQQHQQQQQYQQQQPPQQQQQLQQWQAAGQQPVSPPRAAAAAAAGGAMRPQPVSPQPPAAAANGGLAGAQGAQPAAAALQQEKTTPRGRLEISAQRQQRIQELMQSKDRMRDRATRPFNGPEMRGRSHLSLPEFQRAIVELCNEFGMPEPGGEQIQQMFNKHGNQGLGVGAEEFEALIFRLLCFMLAQGEVSVEQGAAKKGEQRDKMWREEFLKKNKQRIQEVYHFGKKLGEGSFGAVYMVTHCRELSGTRPRERVCKVISKASAEKNGTPHEKVREEFAVLKRLDHPHVLRIFEDFEDETNFYIVMEPCRGGDLQAAVKNPYTRDPVEWERWVAKALQHTLEAVAYCHAKGVIHKDLKPENVMMSSPKGAPLQDLHVVVVDFGLAQMFSRPTDRSHEIAGTPPFMAPEVWEGNFSKGCDVWSCGVMLFYMLSGTYPFMAGRIEDFPKAVRGDPDWSLISGATPDAQWICNWMLCKEESSRPSAQELLKGRWFAFLPTGSASDAMGHGAPITQSVRFAVMQVKERTHFEKFVGRLVATQLDAGQLKKVNEAFRALDADKDGSLSREELVAGLVTLGAAREEAFKVVEELDIGGTGRISYTEFLAGATDLRRKSPQERDELLRLAWQQFNPDKAGLVKTSDLQVALAARGMTVAEMPKAFLTQLQKGATGAMTFEQFRRLFEEDQSCYIMNSFVGGGAAAGRHRGYA